MPRNFIKKSNVDIALSFLNSINQNVEYCESLLAKEHEDITKHVPHIFPSGYQLIRIETNKTRVLLVLIDLVRKHIAFYVQITCKNEINISEKPTIQLLVWKSLDVKHQPVISGLSRNIIINYLLNKHDIIVSDTHQTLQGRSFWIQQIGYAFLEKATTYLYKNDEVTKISSQQELISNSNDIWGDLESYENVFLIITKTKINAH